MDERLGTIVYKRERLDIMEAAYKGGRRAIFLVSEDLPFGTLTVNLPEEHLEEGEFFVKTWTENEAIAPFILKKAGLFEDTGKRVDSGFVQAAIWRFKKEVGNA